MTNKYKRMCEVYKIFSDSYCDFSDQAMLDMYNHETFGIGDIDISGFNTIGSKINGYAVGKKVLNITVAMWFEELNPRNNHYCGWFNTISRLYSDDKFPKWWLDEVFNKFLDCKVREYIDLGIKEINGDPIEKELSLLYKESTKKENYNENAIINEI